MVSYIFTNIFYYHFCGLFHQILERPFVLITACFNRTLPGYAYCVSFENGRTKGQVVRVENKKTRGKSKITSGPVIERFCFKILFGACILWDDATADSHRLVE